MKTKPLGILAVLACLTWVFWSQTNADSDAMLSSAERLEQEAPRMVNHEPRASIERRNAEHLPSDFDGTLPSRGKNALDEEPGVGTLRFRLGDHTRGDSIPRSTLTLMNQTRFARESVGDDATLRLTAGTYAGQLVSPGYERMELEPFLITAEQDTDLGQLWLVRGTGTIEGAVTAPHLPVDEPILVELHGLGRLPCPTCLDDVRSRKGHGVVPEEPAFEKMLPGVTINPCCGYARHATFRRLVGERRFAFFDLAAGNYSLIVRSATSSYRTLRELSLGRGERQWIEIALLSERPLTFVLHDTSGRPYFTPTARDAFGLDSEEEVEEVVEEGDSPVLSVRVNRDERLIARGWQYVYTHAMVFEESSEESFTTAARDPRAPIDRARVDQDIFRVDDPRPDTTEEADLVGHDANTWTITALPAAEVVLRVSCGNATSGDVRVDLRTPPPQPLVLVLREP